MDPNSFDFDKSDIHIKYDVARKLPDDTMDLWMDEIQGLVVRDMKFIVDLGCGTGRFSEPLQKRFNATVIGIDPSDNMLNVARAKVRNDKIRFINGSSSSIPILHEVSMVFMSMCYHYFHHEIDEVIVELDRILEHGGYIIVRNTTKEDGADLRLFDFFPGAESSSAGRMPSEDTIIESMSKRFALVKSKVVTQRFANNREEYLSKIGERGLSSLKMLSDDQFEEGMSRLKRHMDESANVDDLLYEGIHLMVFQKA